MRAQIISVKSVSTQRTALLQYKFVFIFNLIYFSSYIKSLFARFSFAK